MRFTNVKCLTGYLFRFDVIVIVYSIRFIAFTITSSFASFTGFPRSFQSLIGCLRNADAFLVTGYPMVFARFKDLRLKDEKRTHTPVTTTPAAEHITTRADTQNIAGIVSLRCLIRISKPIPIINQWNTFTKLHKQLNIWDC